MSITEKNACIRICAAKVLGRDGIVRIEDTVQDLVHADTGALRGRSSASKGRGMGGGPACDVVRAATDFWSPLEVAGT